ncbi:MAG: hypothetical protein JW925_10610 [Syntrophaceae bacterium]|nr:hypothetical protein [Syntrophaceae bacterium]
MRIWDVNPGYLNRQSLLGEHRELHAIVSIIKNKKTGYSRHPETLRWQGFGWALSQRHRLLAAEMNLRGFTDRSPVLIKTQPQKWPQVFVDSPTSQFSILEKKYVSKEQGRIPLPRNVQALWAQHQYSVMARDDAEYKYIGGWVAARKSGKGIDDIYPELVSLLRCPPAEGNLKKTIQHMWGYVFSFASIPGKAIKRKTSRNLLKEIQSLVFLYNIVYLKESTALGELPAWMRATKT